MNNADIYATLNGVFHEVFDDDSIVVRPELTAANVEGWDSLSHVRLLLAVEDKFQIHFSAAEIGKLKNVEQFVELINSKLLVQQTPTRSQH